MQRPTLLPLSALRGLSSTQRRGLARLSLIGRVGAAPEIQPTSSGRDVVRYVIGTNHGSGDSRTTSWFRVSSFVEGPQKDYLVNIPKGSLVHVEADTRLRSYEDGEGVRHSTVDLLQRSIEVLSRNRAAEEDGAEQAAASG